MAKTRRCNDRLAERNDVLGDLVFFYKERIDEDNCHKVVILE